jgi:hypothetical protein
MGNSAPWWSERHSCRHSAVRRARGALRALRARGSMPWATLSARRVRLDGQGKSLSFFRGAALLPAASRSARRTAVRRGSCRCRATSAKGQHRRNAASRTDDNRLGSVARRSGSVRAPQRGVLPRSWEAYESSVSPILSQLKWIGKPSALSIPTTSVKGSPTTLV